MTFKLNLQCVQGPCVHTEPMESMKFENEVVWPSASRVDVRIILPANDDDDDTSDTASWHANSRLVI